MASNDQIEQILTTEEHITGECYDEDTNDCLGILTDKDDKQLQLPPAQISIYINGYWYIYKMDRRYEEVKPEVKELDPNL